MKYEELLPISHAQLEQALAGESTEEAAQALLRMALNESDWLWAEKKCFAAIHDERQDVRAAATTALGHIARRHKRLTLDVVVPALKALHDDPQLGGLADDALEDILLFVTTPSVPSVEK